MRRRRGGAGLTRRRRRQAVARGGGRSLPLRRIATGAGVAAVAAGLVWGGRAALAWLLDPATFPVRRVEVVGRLDRTPPAAVRRALVPHLRAGLVRLDVAAARAAVEELPWVARAGIRRLWPATVRVEVRERRAVAQWGADELIDAEGVRFAPPRESWPTGLVRIDAPDGRETEAVALLVETAARLRPLGLVPVSLRLDARGAVRVRLADGVVVAVGRGETARRLGRLALAWQAGLRARWAAVERVDLRYANGLAVRWRRPVRGGAVTVPAAPQEGGNA